MTEPIEYVYCDKFIIHAFMFLYAALLFPAKSNLLRAMLVGFVSTYPLLTALILYNYAKEIIITHKGYLHYIKKTFTQQDTIQIRIQNKLNQTKGWIKQQVCQHWKIKHIMERSYSDEIGRFPYISARGYKYIFVYSCGTN